MKASLGNADARIRQALHVVFAEIFDEISEATSGEIVVEDLTIRGYTVDVSVTLRPRGSPEEEFTQEAEE